jgi:hypothetical protein
MNDNIIDSFVEVKIDNDDSFLKIKETLTRIGILSNKENKLIQSCHILFKQGKYYIVHFKEMFLLDGKSADFSDDDRKRRNKIALLLDDWELLKVVNKKKIEKDSGTMYRIKIVPFKEKDKYTLESKYTIGNSVSKNYNR